MDFSNLLYNDLNLIVLLIYIKKVQFLLGITEEFTKGTILANGMEIFTAKRILHVFFIRVNNFGSADS